MPQILPVAGIRAGKTPPSTNSRMQQNRISSNVAIVWLIVLVLVSYQGLALWNSHRAYENKTGERARSLGRLIEGHATAKFDRANASLLEAIEHLQMDDFVLGMRLTDGRRKSIQEMLVERQRRTPGIVSMSVTDKDGIVFANSLGVPPGTSLASRKYFLDLKAQPQAQAQPVISEVIKGRVSNKWGIQVARRFDLPDGSFGGMLVANLGLPENFEEFYGTVGLEPDDLITLRDAENRILVRHPQREEMLGRTITGSSAGRQQVALGTAESIVVSKSPLDGIVRITAVRKLPNYPVFAIVGLGRDAALAPWHKELLLALVVAAVSLAAGGFLTFLLYRREQTIRELALLSFAMDHVADAAFLADPSGRFIYVNDASCREQGRSREELQQLRVIDVDADVTSEEQWRDTWQQISQQKTATFESRHNKPAGGEFPVEVSANYFEFHGKPYVLGLVRDISERKRTENELERHRNHLESLVTERTAALSLAKEAAETANRAKSTFLANMSHELRTPMSAIMGMTSLALRKTTEPKLRDQLTKIADASQHLLAVINDILDISKIEAERLKLEQTTFKLGEVLENLISLIGHMAQEKGLTLRNDLAPDVARLALLGDPLRLGQILLNFAGNAVKFTEQGSITITVRVAEENPEEVLLRFEVQDTGIGISVEDQQRLFTAFEQADGSMTRKYGGTGLGLAISKRLVKMMDGTVGVRSAKGQGSTFWFTVRLGKSVDAVTPAPTFAQETAEARLAAAFAGTRILLAEDEPINREVSRGLLEDVGLVVDLAEDGAEAVEMAKQTAYALILMDMQMPILNGVDATRAIRALPGYAETPILAMTANVFNEDRKACFDAGMNDHIGKPVDPDVLFETLLKWLSMPRD